MRKWQNIGLIALFAVLAARPVFGLEVKFSGDFRTRAAVQAEFDGHNEWTATSVANAIASGNYTVGHIYDRGSHFFRRGPRGEDNPTAAGYATFLAPGGPAAHVANDTVIGPALVAGVTGTLVRGAQDNVDDERVYIDTRWRLWITAKIADCVKQVTAFEVGDATWGQAGWGADWGADDTRVEVKQCYVDFSIPALPFPTRFKMSVIPVKLHRGWILDVDCAGMIATATFEPLAVGLIYLRAVEGGSFEDRKDDADIYGALATFSMDQLFAQATFLYQDGPSSTFTSGNAADVGAVEEFGNTLQWYALDAGYSAESFKLYFTGIMNGGSNDYYRVNDRTPTGAPVAVTNAQYIPVEADYNGWMANLGLDVYLGPLTLMIEGFYVTGDEFKDHSAASAAAGVQNFFLMEDADDAIDRFVYPGPNPWNNNGAIHRWSELLGAGTFDWNSYGARSLPNYVAQVGDGSFGQWQGGLEPYNVWALKVGGKYKLTDTTSIYGFYWYAGTVEDVVSSIDETGSAGFGNLDAWGNVRATDSAIGHEIDFYIDQKLCNGLVLRLVGAYLFADDAYSIWEDDEDAYEYGARLQINF